MVARCPPINRRPVARLGEDDCLEAAIKRKRVRPLRWPHPHVRSKPVVAQAGPRCASRSQPTRLVRAAVAAHRGHRLGLVRGRPWPPLEQPARRIRRRSHNPHSRNYSPPHIDCRRHRSPPDGDDGDRRNDGGPARSVQEQSSLVRSPPRMRRPALQIVSALESSKNKGPSNKKSPARPQARWAVIANKVKRPRCPSDVRSTTSVPNLTDQPGKVKLMGRVAVECASSNGGGGSPNVGRRIAGGKGIAAGRVDR